MQIGFKVMMNFSLIDLKQKNSIREIGVNLNKNNDRLENKRRRRKKRNIKEIDQDQKIENKKKKNIKSIDIKDPVARAE